MFQLIDPNNILVQNLEYITFFTIVVLQHKIIIASIAVVISIPFIYLSAGNTIKKVLNTASKIITTAAGGVVVAEALEKRFNKNTNNTPTPTPTPNGGGNSQPGPSNPAGGSGSK